MGSAIVAQETTLSAPTLERPTSQIPTIKAATRLVGIDIIVTDPQGRSITGLNQEDFKVYEDDALQRPGSFEAHTAESESGRVVSKPPFLPPNTYLNLPNASYSEVFTVILDDVLNTPFKDQAYGQQEILKFCQHRPPGTQIAVFILGDTLHLLKGFTEGTYSRTAGFAPSNRGGRKSEETLQDALQYFADDNRLNRSKVPLDRRVKITLSALTEIGRFLSLLPGRKNLIWYSSGFPENILPTTSTRWAPSYSEQIKQATDLLRLSHVAVFPVDIRGLRTDPSFASTRNPSFREDPKFFNLARQSFINTETAIRASMDTIAEDTGGIAFYSTNNLEEALDRALISGSTYYSLSYTPTNPKYDGSLRHIKITLKKSGYTLAYRKTYYADDLEAAARAAADAPVSPLSPSLERGTPLAHDLLIEAHLDAAGPPVPATPAQMQVLSQYEAMRTKNKNTKPAPVMMQQYFISYGLIARQLDMPEDDKGAHQASIEFGMIAYDDDGRKLNGLDSRIDDAIPAPRYAKVTADGYHAVQSIAVPVTATSLRLAVRDIHSNRTGSLEVKLPLAKIDEAKPSDTKAKDQ